jgi:hypothetical protein
VVTIVCALLAASSPASAHEELSLHALTVLDSIRPATPGLEVRVVHLGAPALAVRNDTASTLSILDDSGRAFLRIGPRGVFANVESAMAYRSIDPSSDSVPDGLGGASRWARISEGRTWTWFDPRLLFAPGAGSWDIAMELNGRRISASGGFEPLESHGHFVTELEVPKVDGLDVRVADGPVPALFVNNGSEETLHVEGQAGEPFLRIGPRGVWANMLSPTYYTSGAQTILPVPAKADPAAPPRWKQISEGPVWGWLERRAAVPVPSYERDALGPTRRTVLEWSSPMRLGTEDLGVGGHIVWIPPAPVSATHEGGTSAAVHVVPLALALAVGVALILRRTRPTAQA